jgi:hypothetical protein
VAARLFRSLSLCFCFAWKHDKRENREEIVSLGSMVKEKTEKKKVGFYFYRKKDSSYCRPHVAEFIGCWAAQVT